MTRLPHFSRLQTRAQSRSSPIAFVCALLTLLVTALPVARAEDAVTEVVVRGRLSPYKGDTAFSGIEISKTDIARASSLDEALRLASQSSLFRRQSSLTANPTIQGLSLRAVGPSGAGRALVTLDGIPLNDPFGNWVIWAALPVDAIDHARVVRGAGGGAYGAGALTGVVDLTLASPRDRSISGQLDVGESGSVEVSVTAGQGRVMFYSTHSVRHGDAAVRPPQRGPADEGVYGKDESWLATFHHRLTPADVTLIAGHYDSRRDTGLKGAVANASGTHVAATLTRQPEPTRMGFRLQAWYRDSDLSNRSVSVAPARADSVLANDQVSTPSQGYGINAALRYEALRTEWEIGIDGRITDGEANEYFRYMAGAPTRFRTAGGRTSVWGVYGQGTRTTGAWSFDGALRIDQWRAENAFRREWDLGQGLAIVDLRPASAEEAVVSARLGLTRQVGEHHLWRLAAYNGFRPPSLNELYRPFRVGNDVTEANADLVPEKLAGIEFGWRFSNDALAADATLFYNRLTDPIGNIKVGTGPGTFPTAGFIPAGGVLRQRQNTGEIRATGLEMSARWRVTPSLHLSASTTLTDAEIRKGDPSLEGKRPSQVPEYVANLSATYRISQTTLGADWLFLGQSFEDDQNRQRLKSASKLRVIAEQTLTPRITLRLAMDNVLDRDIQIQRSGDGTLSYDNGRAVTVSVLYRP